VIITESAWWLSALFGEKPPLHDDTLPAPGFYKRRLIPRGPFVPARIYTIEERDDDGELLCDVVYCCEVNGLKVDAFSEWLMVCKYPISRDEWEMMDEERRKRASADMAFVPAASQDWP
jgi:hypothetical protein